MANFEIPEKPEYSEEIRKFEEEDPGHADLFNAVVETLLNNEVFLKKLADSLAKSISGLNTLTKYTTVQTPNPSMGAQIVQKENTELDMETGLPFPFPIQEVVAGHELALRQLNTDMNAKIKNLLIGYRLNAGDTAYVLGNYGYYRCGIALVFAASTILTETTMLLIDTAQDATDAGGTIKIIESSINYINTKTGCNEYYLWGGKLCIYNLQSDHEYLTVRFIPFF